jgi:pre-mRNA-processing factor 17
VLVAQGDKQVVQWDVRSNQIVQKYNEHLGPVNTITFIDQNRKFVTTSDDKKVYVWEYGIPVVMKHIAEPDMHSMPAVALHPSGKYWIGQSQNNQIHVYGAQRKFGLFRKKRFMGHLTSGYACGLGFSPDGKLLYSGDAQGRLFIWDWRSMKIWKRLNCHKQVTIGAAWNPLYASRLATCSWDGTIKYWD